jgi:regulation of enolase protein 1 (concanavalin A-like superfamily)
MSIISNPPSKPYPHDLYAHNTAQQPVKSFPFTLTIPPRTDLWRKPPSTFSATQPTFYTPLPLSALASATVKIALTPELLYDQAGIVLLWPQRPERWIKAGVEFVGGALKQSVVATGTYGLPLYEHI